MRVRKMSERGLWWATRAAVFGTIAGLTGTYTDWAERPAWLGPVMLLAGLVSLAVYGALERENGSREGK